MAIDLRGHNITFNVPIRNDGYRFLRVQRNVDGNNVANDDVYKKYMR